MTMCSQNTFSSIQLLKLLVDDFIFKIFSVSVRRGTKKCTIIYFGRRNQFYPFSTTHQGKSGTKPQKYA